MDISILKVKSNKFALSLQNVKVLYFVVVAMISSFAMFAGENVFFNSNLFTTFVVLRYVAILFFVLYLLYYRTKIGLQVFLPFIWLLFNMLDYYEPTLNIRILLHIEIVLFLLILNKVELISVFCCYKKIIQIISLFGILGFISFILDFPIPFYTIPRYDFEGSQLYISYYLGYIIQSGLYSLRLCGLFDEPGLFGTIIAMLLCSDGFNLKKLGNLVLFIAGCLTFSFAFWVMVIAFYALKKISKVKIFLVALVLVLFGWTYAFDDNKVFFFEMIKFTEQKITRVGPLGYMKLDEVTDSPWLSLWGVGTNYPLSDGGCSIIYSFILYGLVGLFLTYGSLLVFAYIRARRNYYALIYLIIFGLSIWQRPDIFRMSYIVLLLGGIEYIRYCNSCLTDDSKRVKQKL